MTSAADRKWFGTDRLPELMKATSRAEAIPTSGCGARRRRRSMAKKTLAHGTTNFPGRPAEDICGARLQSIPGQFQAGIEGGATPQVQLMQLDGGRVLASLR